MWINQSEYPTTRFGWMWWFVVFRVKMNLLLSTRMCLWSKPLIGFNVTHQQALGWQTGVTAGRGQCRVTALSGRKSEARCRCSTKRRIRYQATAKRTEAQSEHEPALTQSSMGFTCKHEGWAIWSGTVIAIFLGYISIHTIYILIFKNFPYITVLMLTSTLMHDSCRFSIHLQIARI